MPYWIDLVFDTDKGEPTYLQRASPSLIMEFRRWPDIPGPVNSEDTEDTEENKTVTILPMKLVFKADFKDKYKETGDTTEVKEVGTGFEFLSQAGTSGGKPVQEVRIMLDPSKSHPPEGYAFDVLMEDDNGDWPEWDPRVVSK